jgi:hypothetical protein
MLIYQEVSIAEIIADLIELETNEIHIAAKVVGREVDQGTLESTPLPSRALSPPGSIAGERGLITKPLHEGAAWLYGMTSLRP